MRKTPKARRKLAYGMYMTSDKTCCAIGQLLPMNLKSNLGAIVNGVHIVNENWQEMKTFREYCNLKWDLTTSEVRALQRINDKEPDLSESQRWYYVFNWVKAKRKNELSKNLREDAENP